MSEIIISRNLTCKYCLGEGNSPEQYNITWKKLSTSHLLFYHYKPLNCYIVWNSTILILLKRPTEKANFSFGEAVKNQLLLKNKFDDIMTLDKSVFYKKHFDFYEKIVIVPENKLLEFCKNYEQYIYPSEEDLKNKHYLFALPDDKEITELTSQNNNYIKVSREREKVSRLRRNPNFRDMILRKYNYTCVICGCTEQTILEAAHIKGVAEGGDDSENNGVCLCRNHHGLYDSGRLNIDFKKTNSNVRVMKKKIWHGILKQKNVVIL